MARERSVDNRFNLSMDLSSYDHLPPFSPSVPHPEPLDLRWQQNRCQVGLAPLRINDNITQDNKHNVHSIHPVRSTSLPKGENSPDSNSSWNSAIVSLDSPTHITQTTSKSFHSRHRSDSSSAIMGDFIPLGYSQMGDQARTSQREMPPDASQQIRRKIIPAANPYEFEPETPLFDEDRNAAMSDLLYQSSEKPTSTHSNQMRAARPEYIKPTIARKPTPVYNPPAKPGAAMHRSESSPTVSQNPFLARRNSTPNLEQSQFYIKNFEGHTAVDRGRTVVSDGAERQQKPRGRASNSPLRGRMNHRPLDATSQATSFSSSSRNAGNYDSLSSTQDRSSNISSVKALNDVSEQGEIEGTYSEHIRSPIATPPMRRARSPMKKMFGEHGWLSTSPDLSDIAEPPKRSRSPKKKLFGEHGWLGYSPDEAKQAHSQKKPFAMRKDTSSGQMKKTSLMGKLKNKIDEFSEKADLSPSHQRSEHGKHSKLAVLSIQVAPPEQARVLMELELMLVHTANKFIMNEFCQGRMAVDSIKKTVDGWKSKGRPAVIEFMYDQATQRELIAANQHNFRFHGEQAADPIRITSMLYNWKQVAAIMALRTFCSPDTVILKLLFDVEQILDLLGSVEALMLRLQQIRGSTSEMLRVARLGKSAQEIPRAQGKSNTATTSNSVTSRSISKENSARGGKMSLDTHVEKILL